MPRIHSPNTDGLLSGEASPPASLPSTPSPSEQLEEMVTQLFNTSPASDATKLIGRAWHVAGTQGKDIKQQLEALSSTVSTMQQLSASEIKDALPSVTAELKQQLEALSSSDLEQNGVLSEVSQFLSEISGINDASDILNKIQELAQKFNTFKREYEVAQDVAQISGVLTGGNLSTDPSKLVEAGQHFLTQSPTAHHLLEVATTNAQALLQELIQDNESLSQELIQYISSCDAEIQQTLLRILPRLVSETETASDKIEAIKELYIFFDSYLQAHSDQKQLIIETVLQPVIKRLIPSLKDEDIRTLVLFCYDIITTITKEDYEEFFPVLFEVLTDYKAMGGYALTLTSITDIQAVIGDSSKESFCNKLCSMNYWTNQIKTSPRKTYFILITTVLALTFAGTLIFAGLAALAGMTAIASSAIGLLVPILHVSRAIYEISGILVILHIMWQSLRQKAQMKQASEEATRRLQETQLGARLQEHGINGASAIGITRQLYEERKSRNLSPTRSTSSNISGAE